MMAASRGPDASFCTLAHPSEDVSKNAFLLT